MPHRLLGISIAVALSVSACARTSPQPEPPDSDLIRRVTLAVDDSALVAAERDSADWLTHGRTYREQRYSPLRQIDERNIDQLGLAWRLELETRRGLEATPLVVDGILYTTGAWNLVYAIDAQTGQMLWTWDPKVRKERARFLCCGAINRGLALYRGKVYVGTLDGRLAAIDAATGKPVWDVLTVDTTRAYSITGAPRIVRGMVLIGNSGADFGVRGYISAYDAENGDLRWRTYTVPGDPSQGFESEAMRTAAATWSGEWWKAGGGGTAWDAIVYDPELDLVYVGTGNGSPWNRSLRSPGGGDNLYLASILALRAEDGELVWYFQTTPAETWDYTATQPLVLADLVIGGSRRKVIMQAPKNGFFYVLDRETGQFISAKPIVKVTWATGVDPRTGRPIVTADSFSALRTTTVRPSFTGAHNWQSMAFNPTTGLVYIPAAEAASVFRPDTAWFYNPRGKNRGLRLNNLGIPRDVRETMAPRGFLLAWDPVRQQEVWRVNDPVALNSGTLTTAGNLVFQGKGDGRFVAYRATDGKKLWEAPTGTGVLAGPVSYLVDGTQYITVMAGWGGPTALGNGRWTDGAAHGNGRILSFRIEGKASPLQPEPPRPPPLTPSYKIREQPGDRRAGGRLYGIHCASCHGGRVVSSDAIPDLRYSSKKVHKRFADIVLGGALLKLGMPDFAGDLTPAQVHQIQAYVLSRARAAANQGLR